MSKDTTTNILEPNITNKKLVFISLPMSGLSDEVITEHIIDAELAYLTISKLKPDQVQFVNNLACRLPVEGVFKKDQERIWYLGEALKRLSMCDEAFFWKGWQDARGCMIEHDVCILYGIPKISLND